MPDLYLRVKRLERRIDELEDEVEELLEGDETDEEKETE